MNKEEALSMCRRDEEVPLSGWDFSYIEAPGRMYTEEPPWNYREIALSYMQDVQHMLDMGTGGGEFLMSFPELPKYTHATEGYEPNVDLARMRLAYRGVRVHRVSDDDKLPLADESMELILNRHESYDAAEVFRVLRPGGIFVTQQVRSDDSLELNQWLKIPHPGDYTRWTLAFAQKELEETGFELLHGQEAEPQSRFYDAGAIVYFARMVPWQLPGISVDRCAQELWELQQNIQTNGYVQCRAPRFMIVARKPA